MRVWTLRFGISGGVQHGFNSTRRGPTLLWCTHGTRKAELDDARRGLELRKESHVRFGLKVEIDPNYLEVNKRRAEEATESSQVALP